MSDINVLEEKYSFEPQSSVKTVRLNLGSHFALIRASLLTLFADRISKYLVSVFCPLPDPECNWIA